MKTKILLFFILFSGFAGGLFSQDIIVKRNGDEIKAKVTEITPENIKYKRFSNQSGPDYVVETPDVFMIKYEGGAKDVIEKNAQGEISIRFVEAPKPDGNTAQPAVREERKPDISPKPTEAKSLTPASAKEQYELALAYEEGKGVAQDYKKAGEWYQKAAEQGYAGAQYRFALLCLNVKDKNIGITTKEDFTMRNGAFVNADGLPIDKATARYWLRKASEQGHIEAKTELQKLEASLKPAASETKSAAASTETKPQTTAKTESSATPKHGFTGTITANKRSFDVSIGEINRNEKGNISIDMLAGSLGVFSLSGQSLSGNLTLTPDLWMKIVIGRDTVSAENATINNDNGVYNFEVKENPNRIIVYDTRSVTGKPFIVFDGETKKLLTGDAAQTAAASTATAAKPAVAAEKPFDARTGEHDIVDLIDNKIIEAEVIGGDITYISLRLRKLVSYPVSVKVPVGSYFVAGNSSTQNMVGTGERKTRLTGDSWTSLSVPVACANRPKNIPDSSDKFTIMRSPQKEELTKLMPALDKARASTMVKQAAVWIITDNADYADLGILQTGNGARAIGASDAVRAMQICAEAGIDIKKKSIWSNRQTILGYLQDGLLKNWLESY